MPSKKVENNWKKLSDKIHVTQFSSMCNKQQIYLRKIFAAKTSKNPLTIFLFHDLASYHGRFENFISWMRVQFPEADFVLMDFLGHGLSSGTRGHIENFNDLVSDVAQVFNLIPKNENEEWIALGHGIGALSLLDLINRSDEDVKTKIDRLILSNFVLQFDSPVLKMQERVFSSVALLESAMKSIRPLEIYLPEQMLTHPREQMLYLEDPLIVRKPTFQTFKCINTKAKSIYQDAYFLDRPTLLLQSASPYLFPRGMESFSKGFKKGLLVEKKYSNLKHDLYNERDNLVVFNDILEWINT